MPVVLAKCWRRALSQVLLSKQISSHRSLTRSFVSESNTRFYWCKFNLQNSFWPLFQASLRMLEPDHSILDAELDSNCSGTLNCNPNGLNLNFISLLFRFSLSARKNKKI